MATYTNRHGLPLPLVNAITRENYRREGHISVTELIKPPQMAYLEALHDSKIEVDVADEIYALLGSSVHAMLDRASMDNALQEERLRVKAEGWILTGKPDLYESDGTLTDFKVCSVFSFLLPSKPDWEAQLNVYRVLYQANGFDVTRLQITAILRDWMARRAAEAGYPPVPAIVKEIPLWPYENAVRYIKGRIALHQKARLTGEFSPCTDEERWHKADTWAVKKNGNKRALRVFEDEKSANLFAGTLAGNMQIEFRPGENIRCERYCKALPWCSQGQGLQEGNPNGSELDQTVEAD